MGIEKKILKEIQGISSIDFWEDVMLHEYEELLGRSKETERRRIFDHLFKNISQIEDVVTLSFVLDILTLPIYDSLENFDMIVQKFGAFDSDVFIEKLSDNLRSWSINEERRLELFDLGKGMKNKNSLIFRTIQVEIKRL